MAYQRFSLFPDSPSFKDLFSARSLRYRWRNGDPVITTAIMAICIVVWAIEAVLFLVWPEGGIAFVNVRGCVAHVQVVERHRPPEAADRSAVTNIVARRSGLITKVEALDIGKHRIKFYGKGSITGVDCDKITYYKPFTLPGGLRLPLTLVRERITAWEGTAAERTEQSARQEGEQQLLALLSARLPEGSTVTDTRFAAVRQGDRLTVVLKAECLEQIGQTVTLPETETTQR